jgi:glyoxylase-like metal-dependent hydrolase (beta-lactamase superfamily II)
MKQLVDPDFFNSFWVPHFPGDQIQPQDYLDTVQILAHNDAFDIEGHKVQAIEVGQSDTYNTIVLHIPDLDLVVTGDAVYGEYHQFFLESNTLALRGQWLHAINHIQALGAKHVVPSHKQAWDGFGTDHFDKTRGYIRAWEKELIGSTDAEELVERVKEAYPKRVGVFILELSVSGAFGGSLPG